MLRARSAGYTVPAPAHWLLTDRPQLEDYYPIVNLRQLAAGYLMLQGKRWSDILAARKMHEEQIAAGFFDHRSRGPCRRLGENGFEGRVKPRQLLDKECSSPSEEAHDQRTLVSK
jgi:hypothetical protein